MMAIQKAVNDWLAGLVRKQLGFARGETLGRGTTVKTTPKKPLTLDEALQMLKEAVDRFPIAKASAVPKRELQVPAGGVGKVVVEPGDPTVVEIINSETGAGRAFQLPVPYWVRRALHLDGPESIEQKYPDAQAPDGNPHGDEGILRRRRERELQLQLDIARKKARGAAVPDQPRWQATIARLEAELEALRQPRDQERDRQRSTTGDI